MHGLIAHAALTSLSGRDLYLSDLTFGRKSPFLKYLDHSGFVSVCSAARLSIANNNCFISSTTQAILSHLRRCAMEGEMRQSLSNAIWVAIVAGGIISALMITAHVTGVDHLLPDWIVSGLSGAVAFLSTWIIARRVLKKP